MANEYLGTNDYGQRLCDLISANKDKVAAVGELGLDYDRLNFASKPAQLQCFAKQLLEVASNFPNLPLLLHNRNSSCDMINTLSTHLKKYPTTAAIVHSFDSCLSDLEAFLKLGCYISLNGCSLRTSECLENLVHIPVDRLLLETDAPWCQIRPSHPSFSFIGEGCVLPVGRVKGRNEPCNIR